MEPKKMYIGSMQDQYKAGVQACQERGIYRRPAILVAQVTPHCDVQPLFFRGPLNECSLECPVCGFWRGVWGENQKFAADNWNEAIRSIEMMYRARKRIEQYEPHRLAWWDSLIQDELNKRPPAYHLGPIVKG